MTDGPSGYRIVILGGGPAGYEAALVAVELGAHVTLVERDGMGGSCVLTDCVPSKTLIATAELLSSVSGSSELGVAYGTAQVEAARLNSRVRELASAQSDDIRARVISEGVEVLSGRGLLTGPHTVEIEEAGAGSRLLDADVILLAVGATPREIPGSEPDGDRILSWRQLYELPELPEHLIVVGSGVTGAEFASAYRALGCEVTLVSSRDRVLPGEDADAAAVLEEVFSRRGITVLNQSRAEAAKRTDDGVEVTLTSGDVVRGSHVLIAVGSIPQTAGLGLEEAGIRLAKSGHIEVDRVSRTSVPGVYAAGDCTGVLPLASVAAMQGRIAMWHALGEAVLPLRLGAVSANVFTDPEIATVGVSQQQVESGAVPAEVVHLPLATNARAKMEGLRDGFVKLFVRPGVGTVLGGVVVAPRAGELILSVTMAVQHSLTADQVAHTFAIYPSLSGSLTEAARQLMPHEEAVSTG
ncbi:MAG TPA: NAD(P)H-quinone dehydrogenase [Frankiaceae bacterium]|nr:NAD(P)H-quinone dehydrogenase [Frankiaceae bacterium]